uniref:Uncharacterized protein n=1 Tax=Candidatus Kentrum sp. FM TaxID=2126340 RepID=A0A450TPH2_9GAMM|nr:MAG: hypothetical protein BECKFM1743C_GA0114222_105304 [Candidatus Kentron sp. FM]VFJ73477.1 MAG: hypothetical protein BECKFM1743A_GA0114220_107231 [Candidatus Kentron sp. FM]VFK20541.1 MAG: hypothetical protein BECKFM1743B_GA0114221_107043 [Candidatus Kentron sp. FM]
MLNYKDFFLFRMRHCSFTDPVIKVYCKSILTKFKHSFNNMLNIHRQNTFSRKVCLICAPESGQTTHQVVLKIPAEDLHPLRALEMWPGFRPEFFDNSVQSDLVFVQGSGRFFSKFLQNLNRSKQLPVAWAAPYLGIIGGYGGACKIIIFKTLNYKYFFLLR